MRGPETNLERQISREELEELEDLACEEWKKLRGRYPFETRILEALGKTTEALRNLCSKKGE